MLRWRPHRAISLPPSKVDHRGRHLGGTRLGYRQHPDSAPGVKPLLHHTHVKTGEARLQQGHIGIRATAVQQRLFNNLQFVGEPQALRRHAAIGSHQPA